MAISFNHKDIILSLKKNFIPHFKKYTPIEASWTFPDDNFGSTHISGSKKNENLILSTTFMIKSKEIPIKFIEDDEGTLTIMVAKKPVYVMKPKERMSQKLIITLAKSIKDVL